MSTTQDKHPQQRRYCDLPDHGTGTDTDADRYCYDHHLVRLPRVTFKATTRRGRFAPPSTR